MAYRSHPLKYLFTSFYNSITKKRIKGDFKGDDYFGNKYYELPADPSRGKRIPQRWYVAVSEQHFDQSDMPAEWDAWLRLRRDNPPTPEELNQNLAVAKVKKEKGDVIEAKNFGKVHSDMSSYPLYEEYELTPGEGQMKRDKDKK